MNKAELHRDTMILAETIINLRCSLKKCAKFWGIPKSTVQYRMSVVLPKISPEYYARVIEILDEHNTVLTSQSNHPERWIKGANKNEKSNLA